MDEKMIQLISDLMFEYGRLALKHQNVKPASKNKILRASNRKGKIMSKAFKLISGQVHGNVHAAYENVYNCIVTMPTMLSIVAKEYNFSIEEFIALTAVAQSALGEDSWYNNDEYLPVSIFCYAKPLLLLMMNKEHLLSNGYDDTSRELIYNAVEINFLSMY